MPGLSERIVSAVHDEIVSEAHAGSAADWWLAAKEATALALRELADDDRWTRNDVAFLVELADALEGGDDV